MKKTFSVFSLFLSIFGLFLLLIPQSGYAQTCASLDADPFLPNHGWTPTAGVQCGAGCNNSCYSYGAPGSCYITSGNIVMCPERKDCWSQPQESRYCDGANQFKTTGSCTNTPQQCSPQGAQDCSVYGCPGADICTTYSCENYPTSGSPTKACVPHSTGACIPSSGTCVVDGYCDSAGGEDAQNCPLDCHIGPTGSMCPNTGGVNPTDTDRIVTYVLIGDGQSVPQGNNADFVLQVEQNGSVGGSFAYDLTLTCPAGATCSSPSLGGGSFSGTKTYNLPATPDAGYTQTITYSINTTNLAPGNSSFALATKYPTYPTCVDSRIGTFIITPSGLANNSLCMSFTGAPSAVAPGTAFTVNATMKNIGTATWKNTPGSDYRIRVTPYPGSPWGNSYAIVPYDIAPNTSFTFPLPLIAPSTPGIYGLQYQMFQTGSIQFGSLCDTSIKNVTVTALPTVTLSPAPPTGASPLTTILTWTTTGNPDYCDLSGPASGPASGWAQSNVANTGNKTISGLTSPTTFTITCYKTSIGQSATTNAMVTPTPVYSLTIQPSRGGKVKSTVGGVPDGKINCGTTCQHSYLSGSIVTLQAYPDTINWKFNGWTSTTGSCSGSSTACTLTVDGAKSVKANFIYRPFTYQEF